VLFVPEAGVGTNNQRPGRLVVTKHDRCKDALEDFASHQATEYHKNCVTAANNLTNVSQNKIQPIDVVLDSRMQQQIKENRNSVIPIIETVILCGRQGLPLRGDTDYGCVQSLELPVNNDGNFRAFFRYRAYRVVITVLPITC